MSRGRRGVLLAQRAERSCIVLGLVTVMGAVSSEACSPKKGSTPATRAHETARTTSSSSPESSSAAGSTASAPALSSEALSTPPEPTGPLDVAFATGADGARCGAYKECTPCEVNDCGWCGSTGTCLPLTEGPKLCPHSFSRASSGCTQPRAQMFEEEASDATWVRENIGSMQPDGALIVGRVESPEAFKIPIKRGRCYVLAAHVPYGTWVERPSAPRAYPAAKFIGGGEWQYRSRWGLVQKVCPQTDGEMVAWLGGYDPPKSRLSKGPGFGPWTLQLYSMPIRESELKGIERRDKQEKDDSLARAFCAACYRDYATCKWHGQPGCLAEYAECLRGNRLTPQSCEEGHFAVPEPKDQPSRPNDGGRDL
ncbi:MAG: hypothetical protein U0165_04465 [Polyangiaceae bacterium]